MNKLLTNKSTGFINFSPIKEPALFYSEDRFILEDEVVSSEDKKYLLNLIKNSAELLKLLHSKEISESELLDSYDEFKALCVKFVIEINKSKVLKNEKLRLVLPSCKEFLSN